MPLIVDLTGYEVFRLVPRALEASFYRTPTVTLGYTSETR